MRTGSVRVDRWVLSLLLTLAASGAGLHAVAAPASPGTIPTTASRNFGVAGAQVGVTDLEASIQFYTLGLGFELVEQTSGSAILRNGPVLLGLRQVDAVSKVRFPGDAETHVVFQVRNLKRALEELGKQKVAVVETRPLPTDDSGVFVTIKDLSGNLQQLQEFRPRNNSLTKPEVLNLAVEVTNIKQAREFYCGKLGFEPSPEGINEGIGPPALPLKKAGVAPITLEETASRTSGAEYPRGAQTVLLLGTDDLAAGMAALKSRGIEFLGPPQASLMGRYAAFKDPFGNVIELLQEDHSHTAAKPPVPGGKGNGALKLEPTVITAEDGSKVNAELGRLSVPENREKPGGKQVELAFLRFKSTASKPGAPIVYLAGGPGGSGIAAAKGGRLSFFLALREIGDVIALDQRGTGMSRPDLTCSGAWSSPLDRPSDPAQILSEAEERSWTCSRTLRAAGVDLASYNANASADDLEYLRQALGVPKISLLGISYGTHLALAAIRRHESSLQSVVLAGVEGPDQMLRLPSVVEKQLEIIGELIRSDSQAGATVPTLTVVLKKLFDQLDDQPVTVEVELPLANHKKVQVTVGRFDLQWMTAQALSSREGIKRLPGKIQAMTKGDFSSLGSFAVNARRGWLGSAMPYAVQCASGASPERLEKIKREEPQTLLGGAIDFPFPQICEAWGVPELGPAFREPVHSNVPALFISGTLDTRTPASDAEDVRKNFTQSVHVVIDGAGHGDDLLLSSPEIGRLVVKFLAGQAVTDTRVALAPLKFEPAG